MPLPIPTDDDVIVLRKSEYGRREPIVVENLSGSVELISSIEGSVELSVAVVSENDLASGFIYVEDIIPVEDVDTVTDKVYQDDPNNTVIQSATVSSLTVSLVIRASYPLITIGESNFVLSQSAAGIYEDTVIVTLEDGDNEVQVRTPDDNPGPKDTITVTHQAPPELTSLLFSGSYPQGPTAVTQSEVKAGDTFQLSGTSSKLIDAIEVQDFEASDEVQLITFSPTTSFTVSFEVGDRGDSPIAQQVRARARDASTGAFGPTRDTNSSGGNVDGVNTIILNNTHPTNSFGSITYPSSQQALKGSESASVSHTATDYDVMAYESPTGELDIDSPGDFSDPKSVTRVSGNYNIDVVNLEATATRLSNGAQTTAQSTVRIAAVAPTINISLAAARLRSGGSNGTSPQDHVVTITSDQNLLNAPTLNPDQGGSRGAFQGAGFAGGPTTWTRSLRVSELVPDEKGTFEFQDLVATNLSGMTQNDINSGEEYTLGGFVARDLAFDAFDGETSLGTEVTDFSKLQAGVFTATNQTALKQPLGTTANVTNGYTIDDLSINPTTLIWLDTSAVATNSTGTAQITNVEEIV